MPDSRIAAMIQVALGDARTVLNVGAGAGSYEPLDRHVIAIEPSLAMRRQRLRTHPPAIVGRAELLPLDDQSVDASMATITVHQWHDRHKGLGELVRVTRGPIVVMAFDPDRAAAWWMNDYAPEMIAAQQARDPAIKVLCEALRAGGRTTDVICVPIPRDCTDGFTEAYYARPERFLERSVTDVQSTWNFVEPHVLERFRQELFDDLRSGVWDARYKAWRERPSFNGSLRLVVSTPT